MENDKPVYKRVLLKLSGEAISAGKDGILNFDYIKEIALVIKKCMSRGVQFGIIVGAGNIWRGRNGEQMDRVKKLAGKKDGEKGLMHEKAQAELDLLILGGRR